MCDIDLQKLNELQKTRHVEGHFNGRFTTMDSVLSVMPVKVKEVYVVRSICSGTELKG